MEFVRPVRSLGNYEEKVSTFDAGPPSPPRSAIFALKMLPPALHCAQKREKLSLPETSLRPKPAPKNVRAGVRRLILPPRHSTLDTRHLIGLPKPALKRRKQIGRASCRE